VHIQLLNLTLANQIQFKLTG